MPGQPPLPSGVLGLDCTTIDVNEVGGVPPSNIIEATSDIELSAQFNGDGFVWDALKPPTTPGGAAWNIHYYAESMGPGLNDVDFGVKSGNMTAADLYTAPATTLAVPAGTLTPGIYRIACVIQFPTMPGLVGFFEGAVIEVL